MTMQSTTISTAQIVRSETEPGRKVPGLLWINPSGGQNGNNTERYLWNPDVSEWELTVSIGPDNPKYPKAGAEWHDIANGDNYIYRGGNWYTILPDNASFDSVNIQDSFTDPAGIQHTGELADSDDIPDSAGQTGFTSGYVTLGGDMSDGDTNTGKNFTSTQTVTVYDGPVIPCLGIRAYQEDYGYGDVYYRFTDPFGNIDYTLQDFSGGWVSGTADSIIWTSEVTVEVDYDSRDNGITVYEVQPDVAPMAPASHTHPL